MTPEEIRDGGGVDLLTTQACVRRRLVVRWARMQSMRTALLIAFAFLLAESKSFAKAAYVQLSEMVATCDLIIVAKVESVHSPLFGKKHAKARILEVWKGVLAESETLEFLASPTWTCDISTAIKGETAVLFLTQGSKSRSFVIAQSGRGRMPVRTVTGKNFATFWTELKLPDGVPTIDGPEPGLDFIKSVEITLLRDLVKQTTQK